MKTLDSFRLQVAAFFHRKQLRDELEEELSSHIQHRADDLECSGLPRREAKRRAHLSIAIALNSRRTTMNCIDTQFLLNRKVSLTLALFVLSAALTGTASAQSSDSPSPLQQKLVSIRHDTMTAWQKKDADTLKAIMAPDFMFIGPQGVSNRDGWLAGLSLCSLTSASMDQVQLIQLSEGSAELLYKMHYVGDCGGHPFPADNLVTDTFTRRDGKWWIVATTMTPQM